MARLAWGTKPPQPWPRYRKCGICGAPMGEPCTDAAMDGEGSVSFTERPRPHGERKLRVAVDGRKRDA